MQKTGFSEQFSGLFATLFMTLFAHFVQKLAAVLPKVSESRKGIVLFLMRNSR
jgi:hypothetical protein